MQALAAQVDAVLTTVDTAGKAPAPMTVVRRNAAQTLAVGDLTVVTFDTEAIDELGIYDPGTPTRVTIAQAGWYDVKVHAMANVASGSLSVTLDISNPAGTNLSAGGLAGGAAGWGEGIAAPVQLVAGQRLALVMFSTNGGAMAPAVLAVTKLR